MARKSKKLGKPSSPARLSLLDAARTLLLREGYPGLVGRKVAEEAGVNRELLYYYFSDMDQLIIESFDIYVDEFDRQIALAAKEPDPLTALWRLYTRGNARLFMEYTALANHNEALRKRFAVAAAHQQALQYEAFESIFGVPTDEEARATLDMVSFLFEAAVRNYLIKKELSLITDDGEVDLLMKKFFSLVGK